MAFADSIRHPANRRFHWLIASVCVIFAALGGCGERDDEPVRLELWTLSLRPTFNEYMQDLIAEFEAEHPGVEVVWVDVPFESLNRKLIAAAAAGRAPDVVNFSDMQFARFASLGATLDLSSQLSGEERGRYLPGAMRVSEIGGGLYGLPWYLTPSALMINTTLLAEGGLTPQTLGRDYETLRRQAREFHARTGRFLFTLPLGEESVLPQHLLADGVPPFRVEERGRVRADLTRPEVVDHVRAWVDLYRDGALPRAAATQGHRHAIELYQNGQLATLQTGPNFLARIRDVAPQVYDATEVAPPITGKLGRANIPVMLVSVMSTTRHPALATDLALWVTRADNQLAFAKLVDILPSTPESLSDAYFAAPDQPAQDASAIKLARGRAISAAALRDAVAFTPSLEAWPDMRRAFDERIKESLLNGAPVEHVLAAIERDWNELLDATAPASWGTIPTPQPLPTHTVLMEP